MDRILRNEYERVRELVQDPEWYINFGKIRKARLLGLGAVQAVFSGNIVQAASHIDSEMTAIFERLLAEHEVRLGIPGVDELEDHDQEREPISQVVIHHSSRAEGMTLGALNALHLLRLYVPVYQSESRPIVDSLGSRQPIYSGHFDESGEQVFYGYHWHVDRGGNVDRLLADDQIAWHAGDWTVNKRSVGICIDDDLRDCYPTQDSLEAVADILKTHYPDLPKTDEVVVGHNEVSRVLCPGNRFIGGWKKDLLERAAG